MENEKQPAPDTESLPPYDSLSTTLPDYYEIDKSRSQTDSKSSKRTGTKIPPVCQSYLEKFDIPLPPQPPVARRSRLDKLYWKFINLTDTSIPIPGHNWFVSSTYLLILPLLTTKAT